MFLVINAIIYHKMVEPNVFFGNGVFLHCSHWVEDLKVIPILPGVIQPLFFKLLGNFLATLHSKHIRPSLHHDGV